MPHGMFFRTLQTLLNDREIYIHSWTKVGFTMQAHCIYIRWFEVDSTFSRVQSYYE